jgi:hypothetical protein
MPTFGTVTLLAGANVPELPDEWRDGGPSHTCRLPGNEPRRGERAGFAVGSQVGGEGAKRAGAWGWTPSLDLGGGPWGQRSERPAISWVKN